MTELPPSDGDMAQEKPPLKFNVQDIKEHIWKKHGISVGDDDPILAIWSIHELFLEQFIHDQNNISLQNLRELIKINGQYSDALNRRIVEALKLFQDETLHGTIQNNLSKIVEISREGEKIIDHFKNQQKFLKTMTFINLGVFTFILIIFISTMLLI